MIKAILRCLLFLAAVSPISAAELPPVYAPFKPFLGTWEGKSKIVVTSEKGRQDIEYFHTSHYAYHPEQSAIMLTCTDTNTVTGRTTKTHYTIIWDTPSKKFKMIGVIRGFGARFYHASFKNGAFIEDHIDKPKGVVFETSRKINKDGKMHEVGKKLIPNEGKSYEWNQFFTKK